MRFTIQLEFDRFRLYLIDPRVSRHDETTRRARILSPLPIKTFDNWSVLLAESSSRSIEKIKICATLFSRSRTPL